MQLTKLPEIGERLNGDLVLAIRTENQQPQILWRGKWESVELPEVEPIPQAPTPPTEPDPYPVGTRRCLKSWFEPFDPKNFKPEWWTVTESANEFGIYGLRSDSGNWAGLQAWQIERDEVKS